MVANRLFSRLTTSVAVLLAMAFPVAAHAALTVTPITWNIVGLDSNTPATGPNRFPVGARVCTDNNPSTISSITFNWTSANVFVDLRAGSLTTIPGAQIPALGANGCYDAYFEVEVQKNALAFDTTRRYTITATDGTGTYSSPTPREIYVEHLISQSRNSVSDVKYGPVGGPLTSVAAGGSLNLVVGNTYDIALVGGTATQGYNQFEAFINFPNTIFQILAVDTDYAANNSPYVSTTNHTKLYADACRWENDPNSPVYRACYEDWKSGGAPVTTTYTVKILSGGGTSQQLNTLLYDFSGSSYHYNADYSVGGRVANIIDPTAANFSKSFTPSTIGPNATSTLLLTINNPNAGPVSGYNFVDNLPSGVLIATPANASTTGCGAGAVLTANAGGASITLTNASAAANGNCVVSVNVTSSTNVLTTYTNTTQPLFVGTTSTGKIASANLTVDPAAVSNGTGLCGVTLARWTFPTGFNVTSPAASTLNVASASASAAVGISKVAPQASPQASTDTSPADGTGAWATNGLVSTSATLDTTQDDYFEFALDTSQVTSLNISLAAEYKSGNGPKGLAIFYGTTQKAAAATETGTQLVNNANALSQNAFTTITSGTVNTGLSTTGLTYFRVYGFNAGSSNAGADFVIDTVTFTGCKLAVKPTIAKAFSPNPIGVSKNSTLTFTLTNPNSVALNGAAFTDTLPGGLVIATPNGVSNTCGGSLTATAGTGSITLTGGVIPTTGCMIAVNVTGNTSGAKPNISGQLSTTESGSTPTTANATLTVLDPPTLTKKFGSTTVVAGGTTTLTLSFTNPNQSASLSSVAVNDTLPGGMLIATPNALVNTCGGAVTATAGSNSIAVSGVTLAAGAVCTVKVNVLAPNTAGPLTNTTGTVSAVIGGVTVNGLTASDSITVTAANPKISLLKQIGPTASGPWTTFIPRNTTTDNQAFYRFTLENIGDVPLSSLALTDDTLAAGILSSAKANCTQSGAGVAFATATLAVPNALNDNHLLVCTTTSPLTITVPGSVTNTATASGTYLATNTTVTDTATARYATTALTIDKTATETLFQQAGDVMHYSYLVTNSGFAPLTSPLTVSDNKTTVTCPAITTAGDLDAFLDPGESITCTATYVITASDVAANFVTNTASASAKDTLQPTANTVTSNSDSVTINRVAADLSVTKTDGVASVISGNSTIYTITVTNSGPTTVTGATLQDPAATGLSKTAVVCSPTPGQCSSAPTVGSLEAGFALPALASGQTYQIRVTATVTASSGNVTNTATITTAGGIFEPDLTNNTASDTDSVTTSADLSISKTDGSGTYTPGASISYTITVTNNGPSTVTSVTVTDTVPAAITSPNFTPSAGSYNSGTGAWTGLSLASGQSVTLTLSGTVSGSATGNLVNTATVAPPAGTTDPNPANDSSTDTDTPNPQADLAITKTDGSTTYTAGAAISYTITVTNNGPSTVTSVTVTDTVPAAILTPNFTPSAGSYNSGTGAWTGLTLASGQSVTLTLSGTVSGSATGNLVNTATVAPPAGTTDPNAGNNSATDTDTPNPQADLAITKTDGSGTYTPGAPISYTITVTNNGPSTVTSVTVTDTVPAAITSPVFTPSAGSYNSGTGAWTGLTLASGQSVTLTLSGTVSGAATGNLVNTATVAPPAGTTDPNAGNNSSTDTDTQAASADLSISKTDGSGTYTPGASISYTITVTNNGPSTVTSVTVTDTVPAAITSPNFTPSAGSYNSGTGAWTGLTLASGQSVTLTLSGTVSGSATGNLVNTATVAPPAGTTDPNPANDSSTDTDTPNPQADLAITKTDGSTTYTAGAAISYTITVTNNGPSTVTSVTVTDTVPAAITSPVFTPSAGSYNSGTGAWTGLTLASGQSVTLTLSGTVSGSATGNLVNTATVAPPAGTTDPNAGNNSATDTDTPNPQADLAITKTDGSGTYTPGAPISYTITVTNNGPSTVTSVTVTDPVAAAITSPVFTPSAGSYNSGTGAWTGLTLASGQSVTLTLSGTVSGAATGNLVNTASVAPPAGTTDPNPGNNSSTDTDTQAASADLSISKTDGSGTYTPGASISYTITVTNNGPSTVTSVTVTDTVPAAITSPNFTPSAGSYNSGTGAWTGLTLASGQSVTLTLSGTVSGSATGNLVNTATVAPPAGTTDPNPGNDSSTDTDTPSPQADLAITKTDGSTTYTAGAAISYTITVTNNGPSTVTSVTVTDLVPAAITSPVFTPSAGSYNSGTGAWTGLSLASGQSVTLTLSGTVSGAATGNLVNTATVAPPAGTTDPNAGNNSATDTDTPNPQADLAITKTDGSGTYTPGAPISYTITVTNNGPSTVTSVTVTDPVPAAITSPVFTPSAGSYNSGTGAWTGLTLASGQSVTLTLSGTVSGAATGNLVNTASVAPPAGTTDPNPGNNSSTDTDTPAPRVDLTIGKSDGGASVAPGGTVSYTLTYSNGGNVPAGGVVITETVPSNTTFNAGASTAGWSCAPSNNAGSTCTISIGAVAAGAGGSVTFAVTVANPLAAGVTQISNTATIAYDNSSGPDTNPADNTASDTTPVTGAPDLTLSKSDGGASVAPGGTVSYTLTYNNTGNRGASGVTITETVPANTTFNAGASTAGWSCAPNNNAGSTCTISIGTVAVSGGGSVTFAVTVVNPLAAGVTQISNSATIADDGTNGTDPNPGNNGGSDTTPVTGAPDLSLTKSDGGASVAPGGTVSYALTYSNAGNRGATGVVISETVPANTTFNAGASTAGWSCAPNNNAGSTCTISIGAIAASGGGSATFAVTVANPLPAGVTQISNTATIADDGANGTDPTPGNNSGSDTTPVTGAPDLSLTKSDGGASVAPGGTVSYTLTYSNAGNRGATGVVITETVPANTTFNAGASTAGWSCAPNNNAGSTCTISIGAVAASGGGSATFAVTVANPLPAGVTQISNSATIGDDGTNGSDPNPGDNGGSDTTPVTGAPDLSISKSDGGASVAPGGTAAYTLTYSNTGNRGATGVVITETVPANTTFNAGASTAGWSCVPNNNAGSTCTLSVGALAASGGGSATFAVTVANPLAGGVTQISNTATISDDGANGTDPTPGNNSGSDTTPVTGAPDLSLTKSDGGASVAPGGTVSYTLTYSNTGNRGAAGVVITETVPANTTFNAGASTAGWSCAPNNNAGSTCTISIGAVASSGGGSVTFAVTVANPLAAGVTQISNTASISDDGTNGTDPTPGNNSASDTTPVTGAPDLTLTKSDGGASVAPGGTVAYTLTYNNTGNRGASGVTITETVPANTTFNAGASTAGWSCAPNNNAGSTCTISIGTVAVSGGGSVTFAVTVVNPLAAGVTQISNAATIADDGANGTDPNPGNNGGSDTTPVTGAPDLTLTKSDGGASVAVGGTVSYTLTYSNTGNRGATGVTITETVPANTTFNAGASTAGWSCAPNNNAGSICTLSIGTVAAAGGGTATFAVTVDSPLPGGVTQISNTATISDDGANGTDPTPGNNTGSDTTPISIATIDAVNDDFTGTPINGFTGGTTATVFVNDTLNGVPFAASAVNVTLTNNGTVAGASIASDGTISIPAGTPAGPYTLTYQICEVANPSNCDSATAKVLINPPVIDAVNDDFTGTPINGFTGGTTATVFTNDTLNGASFANAAVKVTLTNNGTVTGASIAPDGKISIPAGTQAGTYTLTYQICEVLNPTNCDSATAKVLINPPVIDAVNDDFTGTPINGFTGGTTATVFTNDTLNGAAFAPAAVNVTLTDNGTVAGAAIASNGTISIPAGTKAGTYTLTYQICEVLNATNCDSATAKVLINPPVIDAVNDDFTGAAMNVATGGTTATVFTNDTLNGSSFASAAVNVTLTNNGGVTGASIAPNGTITIPAGTAAGTYTLTYQICEVLNATNCDSATAKVLLNNSSIDAVNDDFTGTPIQGWTGGTTATVFTNDTLNGSPFGNQAVNVTLTANGGVTGATIAPDGTISIPAGTPGNTYTLTYQICEVANPSNCDSATVMVLVTPSADVSVVKTLTTAGPFNSGQSVTYTLVVANAGPNVATGIQVTDTPTNLTITNVTGSGCAALPCTIASLAVGANTTITVTATITSAGAFDNSTTVTATEFDPNPSNNTDNTNNGGTTGASADISVVKTLLTSPPFSAGQTVSYTLLVANAGPSPATNIQVTDTPTNLTITGVAGAGCSALPCTVANLAVGANVTITVTATINASGAFDNSTTVTATEFDPNTSNNTDNTGNGGNTSATVDLMVTKTASVQQLHVGDSFNYTIVVHNNGPSTATGVVMSDPLPANFQLLTATSTQGTCTGTTTVTCSVGTMLNGATVTITISGKVTSAGSLANTATVSANESESVTSNNTSIATPAIIPAAGIPTLGEYGLMFMAAMLAIAGAIAMRGRL